MSDDEPPDPRNAGVSATTPDWAREACSRFAWDPGRQLLRTVREYQKLTARWGLLAGVLRPYWVLQHRFWSAVTSSRVPLNCQLGGGLMLSHASGVVIHPDARLGPNCLIFQQVAIASGGRKPGVPTLDGHVDVGAGAKILGGVHVGAHAQIGANAVVLDDVPAGAIAVGVPARILAP